MARRIDGGATYGVSGAMDRSDARPSPQSIMTLAVLADHVAALFEAAHISYQAPLAESFLARHRRVLLAH